MGHTLEPASSGRSKCRGCGKAIPKGELRLGERLPNPFADEGDMVLWFHPHCGALKRPAALLEALEADDAPSLPERAELEGLARRGLEHERLPRLAGAERAPTARAKCRSCGEKIEKQAWRLRLVFFEDGLFSPSGFVHAGCAAAYVGCDGLLERLELLAPLEDDAARAELRAALGEEPA